MNDGAARVEMAIGSDISMSGSCERERSDLRAELHTVIDAIDHVLADRRVAGTAG